MCNYGRLLTALCLVLFVLPAVHVTAAGEMPVGSYLTRPVSDVDELCGQLRDDPVVAERFTRHFGVSTASLITYFKENLVVSTLAESGRYVEYFVGPGGRMTTHVKHLEAGTPILIASNDTPFLDLRCGNPMTRNLPRVILKSRLTPQSEVASRNQQTASTPAQQQPAPALLPTTAPDQTQTALAETLPPPGGPVAPPAPVVEPQPTSQVLAAPPQEVSFSPNIGRAALLLIPVLGAVALGNHGGGGDESTPPPVPEPSSVLTLLMGAGSIIGMVASKRRYRNR